MAPPTDPEPDALARAWAELIAGESTSPAAPSIDVTGESRHFQSRLPVDDVAVAAVATALRAAAAFGQQRGGPTVAVTLDRAHVAAAVRSERYFQIGGQPAGASFAPLSRFWRTADGWIRTHANYPWHRRALLSALGLPASMAEADAEGVIEAAAEAAAGQQRGRDRRSSLRRRRSGSRPADSRGLGQPSARPDRGEGAPDQPPRRRSGRPSPAPSGTAPDGRHPRPRPHPGHCRAGLHSIPGRPRGRRAAPRPARPTRYDAGRGGGHDPRQTQRPPESGVPSRPGPAARPAGWCRRRRSRLPAGRPRTLRSGIHGPGRSPCRPGRRPPRCLGPWRPVVGAPGLRQHRAGGVRNRHHRVRRTARRRGLCPASFSITGPAIWRPRPPSTACGDRAWPAARSFGPCRWPPRRPG